MISDVKTKCVTGAGKDLSPALQEEMARAAAAAVVMALTENLNQSTGKNNSIHANGHASAWVVQARMVMTNRWPS
jgi:hypothetical protein